MTTKIINNTEYEIVAQEAIDIAHKHRYLLTRKIFQFSEIWVVWYCTPQGCFYPRKFTDANKAKADYHARLANAYSPTTIIGTK